MYICICIYIHIYMCVYMCICVCARACVRVCLCVCVCLQFTLAVIEFCLYRRAFQLEQRSSRNVCRASHLRSLLSEVYCFFVW